MKNKASKHLSVKASINSLNNEFIFGILNSMERKAESFCFSLTQPLNHSCTNPRNNGGTT